MYYDGWVCHRTWWQTDRRSLSLSHFNAAKPDCPDSERGALQTGMYTPVTPLYTRKRDNCTRTLSCSRLLRLFPRLCLGLSLGFCLCRPPYISASLSVCQFQSLCLSGCLFFFLSFFFSAYFFDSSVAWQGLVVRHVLNSPPPTTHPWSSPSSSP